MVGIKSDVGIVRSLNEDFTLHIHMSLITALESVYLRTIIFANIYCITTQWSCLSLPHHILFGFTRIRSQPSQEHGFATVSVEYIK